MKPENRFQGMNSASLCSLAGRYDNPIPPRFLAPIDSLKIPAGLSQLIKETPRRRIMVTSSLNEIFTDQLANSVVGGGGGSFVRSQPCLQQATARYLKTTWTVFPPTLIVSSCPDSQLRHSFVLNFEKSGIVLAKLKYCKYLIVRLCPKCKGEFTLNE
jgi:hypothetical protein